MQRTTSRRAILAGIAVSPALAVSTLTLAGATLARHKANLAAADAELLELGRQHDALRSKYEIALELSGPRNAAWSAALEGLSKRFEDRPEYNAGFEEELKKAGEQLDRDFPAPTPSWEDVMDLMCPIERKIMALPASTFAGLAVKARVAKSACDNYWDEPDGNCDWDQLMARKLIEAVLSGGAVS
jgi:hypothetical protein